MKKLLVILFVATSMIGVAHAQTNTTITQDTADTARATCFSNGGTAEQCQAAYDTYMQSAGTSVPNSSSVQTPQSSTGSGFVALAPIPGLTQGVTADQTGLANFFNNLYKYLIGLAAVLAVIEIIWGGLEISTKDSVSKQSDGKERITQAIFGLVLVLSPVLVFSIINPSILNLSLNLPKLDTASGTSAGGGGSGTGTQAPTTDTASGCTVSGVSGILQIASCPTSDAATKWVANCSGRASAPDVVTKLADGTPVKVTITCSAAQDYRFIDTHTSFSLSALPKIQPLAITSQNPNNGASVVQFASICQAAGRETCIDTNPLISFAVSCDPTPTTPLPASAPGKCYNEILTCKVPAAVTGFCGTPSWTPFQ